MQRVARVRQRQLIHVFKVIKNLQATIIILLFLNTQTHGWVYNNRVQFRPTARTIGLQIICSPHIMANQTVQSNNCVYTLLHRPKDCHHSIDASIGSFSLRSISLFPLQYRRHYHLSLSLFPILCSLPRPSALFCFPMAVL